MIQAIFDDLNPETRHLWSLADGRSWDADRNTDAFIRMLPIWKAHGLLSFTVGLQGGSPEGYSKLQPWVNSAIEPDGSLRSDYMKRLSSVLQAADDLGMIPIVSIFYYAQVARIVDESAVCRAVDNFADWLIERSYKHVLIEVANESNAEVFHHEILFPHRILELVNRIRDRSRGCLDTKSGHLLTSTSFLASHALADDAVGQMDFILLHGNDAKSPDDIRAMAHRVKAQPTYRGQPIVFNEDDHYGFDQPDNHFLAALDTGASWGYFDYRRQAEAYEEGFQSMPCSWRIDSARKRAYFDLLGKVTGKKP
jgi:hypothetical protein